MKDEYVYFIPNDSHIVEYAKIVGKFGNKIVVERNIRGQQVNAFVNKVFKSKELAEVWRVVTMYKDGKRELIKVSPYYQKALDTFPEEFI